ncbi:UDP-N-acetylglucosamine 2-epimerase [Alphaproteobacteria bacterium LSUCC0719]
MKNALSISFFSGNRADFGPLQQVLLEATKNKFIDTSLIISETQRLKPIKNCNIFEYKEDLNGDDEAATCKSSGNVITKVGSAIKKINPRCLVILGDRFEALAAAQAAVIFKVPIAHICGGDTTNGSFDQYFRNAISILSELHFSTNSQSTNALKNLGIKDKAIFEFGHPGVDAIQMGPVVSRQSFFKATELNPELKTILVSFHSITSLSDLGAHELSELIAAIEILSDDHSLQFLITAANPDPLGQKINASFIELCSKLKRCCFIHTLGTELFRGALIHCDMFIGNSSALIYEAPVIGQHAILIGERQSQRTMPTVVQCIGAHRAQIVNSINATLFKSKPNPDTFFGTQGISKKIVDQLVSTFSED